jgi:hypothetical protein
MDCTFGFVKKTNSTTGGTPAPPSPWDRRSSRRCKITLTVHIRPSGPTLEPFDDVRSTHSVSQTGVSFRLSEPKYKVGMRLLLSIPDSNDPATMTHEYLTEVVRCDSLPNGLFGIGVKILMEMGLQGGYDVGYSHQRKQQQPSQGQI